jgi:type IV pilus assembly protein PilA
VSEAFILASSITKTVTDYYSYHGKFPKDNQATALPKPENLGGKYVESMRISFGAIHVIFKKQLAEELSGKTLTLRPVIANTSPAMRALIWVCGYAEVPEGLSAVGENQTNLAVKLTPLACLSNGT